MHGANGHATNSDLNQGGCATEIAAHNGFFTVFSRRRSSWWCSISESSLGSTQTSDYASRSHDGDVTWSRSFGEIDAVSKGCAT